MMLRIEKWWLLSVFVVVGILGLLFIGSKSGSPANAQAELSSDMETGILVIPTQLGRDSYGLAMVDTIGQTMWVYEFNNRGPVHNRLRLLAARNWRYDRLLQQYNTAEPKPEQVKMLLEDLGEQLKEQGGEKQNGSNINTLEATEPNNGNFDG